MLILYPDAPELKKVDQGSTSLLVFEGQPYSLGLSFPKRSYERMQKTLEEDYAQTQIPYFLVDMGDYYTAWHALEPAAPTLTDSPAPAAQVSSSQTLSSPAEQPNSQPSPLQSNNPRLDRLRQISALREESEAQQQRTQARLELEAKEPVSSSAIASKEAATPTAPDSMPDSAPDEIDDTAVSTPAMQYRGAKAPADPALEHPPVPKSALQYRGAKAPADPAFEKQPTSKPVVKYRGVVVEPAVGQDPDSEEQEFGQQEFGQQEFGH